MSGSQNFNLMHNITQSLAGRVAIFRLFPFDMQEMKSANWLSEDLGEVMLRGFYPALHHRDVDPDRYYADYIDTYINRDVTQLINLQDNRAFRRFIKICATRAGQLVNYNNIAKDAGISHTTARNWLSLLETSYIIHFLQPYYKNYSKRVIKSPKLYFYDTGLLCHLLNIRNGKLSPTHTQYDNLFENMVVSEYVKQNYHNDLHREYWFWRDSHGNEIDLLYPTSQALHTYEIKSSTTIRSNMFNALRKFEEVSTDLIDSKTVVYGGLSDQKRTDFLVQSWKNVKTEEN